MVSARETVATLPEKPYSGLLINLSKRAVSGGSAEMIFARSVIDELGSSTTDFT